MNHTRQASKAKQVVTGSSQLDIGAGLFITDQRETVYSVFAPLHYEAKYPYPLIIWLHNEGTDERQLMRIMPLVSIRNYVAAAPRGFPMQVDVALKHDAPEFTPHSADRAGESDGSCLDPHATETGGSVSGIEPGEPRYHWQQTPELIPLAEHRVFETIDAVRNRFHVSPSRVFLAGFSSGGTMAFRLAMQHPDRFAGVLSLDGPFPSGQTPLGRLDEIRNLPVFLAVGRDSRAYPPQHVCDHLRLFHAAGISVSLRQYPCGHELSPQMLRDMDRWIIEQVTSPSPSADNPPCV